MKIVIELSDRDYKMIKNGNGMNIDTMYAAIESGAPTLKGHWKHSKCNVCGASRPPLFDNFCPNCGADMRGEE